MAFRDKKIKRLDRMNKLFVKTFREERKIEQNNRCIYCKAIFKSLTTEHKASRYNFGSNKKENIAASCESCNNTKDKLNHSDFMKKIQTKKPEFKYLKVWSSRRIHERAILAVSKIEKKCR